MLTCGIDADPVDPELFDDDPPHATNVATPAQLRAATLTRMRERPRGLPASSLMILNSRESD
jgi:hypothetical protein